MAAVPITLVGILASEDGTSQNVTFTGLGNITGLSVGGGPMPGGPPPHPAFPISGPPGSNFPDKPGYPPVAGWPGGGPGGAHPEHPIVIPPPPLEPPVEGGVKPPPPDGGWGYHPEYGWGYFPGKGGKPQPGGAAS